MDNIHASFNSVYLFFIGELGHWTIKEECLEEIVTLAAKEGNNKIMFFFFIILPKEM